MRSSRWLAQGNVYLVTDDGVGMEDSPLICAYLDSLDGKPRFHHPSRETDWAYRRLEASARSLCDGITVWTREMARPENERSPTVLTHEVARIHPLPNEQGVLIRMVVVGHVELMESPVVLGQQEG